MISTHVLDIARGGPAVGVTVILELRQASEWTPVGRGSTDEKGRVLTFTDGPISPGAYRLTFDVAEVLHEPWPAREPVFTGNDELRVGKRKVRAG